jgi:uncharacterized protein with FMN-binding domain
MNHIRVIVALVSFVLVAAGFSLACYAASQHSAEQKSTDACIASVRVPANDGVYANLAVAQYYKIHMTCPINVKEQRIAIIYILHGREVCNSTNLFGFPVVSRKIVTDREARKAYGECSGVVHLKQRTSKSRSVVTYAWYAALSNASDREHEMDAIFPKLTGRVISSGLPILQFLSLNNIFCFEVDAGYNKNPLEMAHTVGIAIPPSIHQTRYLNTSCEELFHLR